MKYLYFKIYQILRKIKTNDTPATNAIVILSIFEIMNIITIQVLLNYFLYIKIELGTKSEIKSFSYILGISIMILNYFVLYKKREKICEKYKNESKLRSRVGFAILILYCVSSAILVYVFGSKYPL
jgi:hypothetical protein